MMEKRLANADDIPDLVALRKRQLTDEGLPPIIAEIDQHLADYFASAMADGSFVAWVMEAEDKIIATGGICFYALPPTFSNPTGRVAYITNMYTQEEYRRNGIATELLSAAMCEAKTRGYKITRLPASEEGKPIYRKAGFTDSNGYMMIAL